MLSQVKILLALLVVVAMLAYDAEAFLGSKRRQQRQQYPHNPSIVNHVHSTNTNDQDMTNGRLHGRHGYHPSDDYDDYEISRHALHNGGLHGGHHGGHLGGYHGGHHNGHLFNQHGHHGNHFPVGGHVFDSDPRYHHQAQPVVGGGGGAAAASATAGAGGAAAASAAAAGGGSGGHGGHNQFGHHNVGHSPFNRHHNGYQPQHCSAPPCYGGLF